jgi:hypothetical protein
MQLGREAMAFADASLTMLTESVSAEQAYLSPIMLAGEQGDSLPPPPFQLA